MPEEAHDIAGFRIIVTLLTAMVSSGVYGQSETTRVRISAAVADSHR